MIPLAADPQACAVPPPPLHFTPFLPPSIPPFLHPCHICCLSPKEKNQSLHHELLRCLPTASEIYRRVVSLSVCVSFPLSLSLFSCTFSLRFVNYAQQNEFNILFSFPPQMLYLCSSHWVESIVWNLVFCSERCDSFVPRPMHRGCLQKIYLFVHSFLYDQLKLGSFVLNQSIISVKPETEGFNV